VTRHLWLAFLTLVLADSATAAFFEGRVVGVIDGDTIDVLVGHETRRVRLFGIDTPERGQPWYQKSKSALSRRVFGKEVRVNDVARDRYGRTVGEVYADNVCVGCELVREGNAWVYRKYTDDRVLYELEAEARAAHRGLWSLPEAQQVPPWEWRHPSPGGGSSSGNSRAPVQSRVNPDVAAPDHAGFTCAGKRVCREMTSCAEARFYLEQCGLTRLDGDSDGVPCEAICR
jgi:endonuclease YncB( thermonuclease family)